MNPLPAKPIRACLGCGDTGFLRRVLGGWLCARWSCWVNHGQGR